MACHCFPRHTLLITFAIGCIVTFTPYCRAIYYWCCRRRHDYAYRWYSYFLPLFHLFIIIFIIYIYCRDYCHYMLFSLRHCFSFHCHFHWLFYLLSFAFAFTCHLLLFSLLISPPPAITIILYHLFIYIFIFASITPFDYADADYIRWWCCFIFTPCRDMPTLIFAITPIIDDFMPPFARFERHFIRFTRCLYFFIWCRVWCFCHYGIAWCRLPTPLMPPCRLIPRCRWLSASCADWYDIFLSLYDIDYLFIFYDDISPWCRHWFTWWHWYLFIFYLPFHWYFAAASFRRHVIFYADFRHLYFLRFRCHISFDLLILYYYIWLFIFSYIYFSRHCQPMITPPIWCRLFHAWFIALAMISCAWHYAIIDYIFIYIAITLSYCHCISISMISHFIIDIYYCYDTSLRHSDAFIRHWLRHLRRRWRYWCFTIDALYLMPLYACFAWLFIIDYFDAAIILFSPFDLFDDDSHWFSADIIMPLHFHCLYYAFLLFTFIYFHIWCSHYAIFSPFSLLLLIIITFFDYYLRLLLMPLIFSWDVEAGYGFASQSLHYLHFIYISITLRYAITPLLFTFIIILLSPAICFHYLWCLFHFDYLFTPFHYASSSFSIYFISSFILMITFIISDLMHCIYWLTTLTAYCWWFGWLLMPRRFFYLLTDNTASVWHDRYSSSSPDLPPLHLFITLDSSVVLPAWFSFSCSVCFTYSEFSLHSPFTFLSPDVYFWFLLLHLIGGWWGIIAIFSVWAYICLPCCHCWCFHAAYIYYFAMSFWLLVTFTFIWYYIYISVFIFSFIDYCCLRLFWADFFFTMLFCFRCCLSYFFAFLSFHFIFIILRLITLELRAALLMFSYLFEALIDAWCHAITPPFAILPFYLFYLHLIWYSSLLLIFMDLMLPLMLSAIYLLPPPLIIFIALWYLSFCWFSLHLYYLLMLLRHWLLSWLRPVYATCFDVSLFQLYIYLYDAWHLSFHYFYLLLSFMPWAYALIFTLISFHYIDALFFHYINIYYITLPLFIYFA